MFGLGATSGFLLLFLLLPFLINARLAVDRGKSVILTLLLTFIFSWIVTLILAFVPKTTRPLVTEPDVPQGYWFEKPPEKIKCPYCDSLTDQERIYCRNCGKEF